MTLNIVFWNVRSLKDRGKISQITDFLFLDNKPHIIILAETWKDEQSTRSLLTPLGRNYTILTTNYSNHNRGVAILYQHKYLTHNNAIISPDGWHITVDFLHLPTNHQFTLTGLYSPSQSHSERSQYFQDFFSSHSPADNHILMGDFNISLTPMDQYNCQSFDQVMANSLSNSLALWNLIEPTDDSTEHMPTWFKSYSDPTAIMKKIDYLFATPHIVNKITPAQVYLNPHISDHSPIFTTLNFNNHLPKPRWKLNPLLISSNNLFCQHTQAWASYMSQATNLHEWLCYKQSAIENIALIQSQFQRSQNRLITTIKENIKIATLSATSHPSPQNHTHLSALVEALNHFTKQKSAVYLSRLQLHKDLKGELPSSFISSLMEEQTCTTIDSIDTGTTTLTGATATEYITSTFQEIYSKKSTCQESASQLLCNLPQLSASHKSLLQSPITIDEITAAIQNLSPHKAPGPDGLSAFFYQQFSHLLAPTLLKVFHNFLHEPVETEDHSAFLFALISMVPKKVKVIKAFSHIRPISLLNIDYKILSKIINSRFAQVMPSIIHPDQTGYIKGRFILNNAMALRLSLSQSESCHVFIDFEKAFDKIQHHWIRECLEGFGFPPAFINWIHLLQSHNTAAFYFNCQQQGLLQIQSGNRQGDPMSGNLFVIGIEPLAIQIRNNPAIKHAFLSISHSKVIGLHVDDIWMNTADTTSMSIAVSHCHSFCKASGSVINIKKSYTLNQLSDDQFGFTTIPDSGFTHLGIPVNKNGQSFPATTIISKVQKSAQALKNLHLSLQGYKLLAHCYLYSLFTYTAYILEPPTDFYKSFSKSIKTLMWTNRPKVSHKRLIQTKENFGIGLKDPKTLMLALHTSFMMKLLSVHSPISAAITEHYTANTKNLKVAPAAYKFNKTHSWLKLFFTAFPNPQPFKGLFLHINGKHKEYIFHSTHLRRCKVILTKTQNISSLPNIKTPKGNAIPLPYLKSQGILSMTWNLHHLKCKHFTTTPTLQSIYDERLEKSNPPPDLSESTIKKLQTYSLDDSVFTKIWKLKVRPYTKQFGYLFLLNSLPIYHGQPCIACQQPLSQNHIFELCPFFTTIMQPKSTNLSTLLINLSAIWLTFNKLTHDQQFHPTSATLLWQTILQSETNRHNNMTKQM